MSVVGFDFGNERCVIAAATEHGIKVVFNDESNPEIPAVVCFGDKQRFFGAHKMVSPRNTISQIKTLIGRQYSDPYLQRHLKSMPFLVTEGSDGYPLIHVRYLGEQRTFTPTQVLGMLFSYLKGLAEKKLSAPVGDCCIGIPAYFTDLQRRAVINAAKIAGLHPLQLVHETTAAVLAYGDKTELPESHTIKIAIVDIGHSSMQVSIAGWKKGGLRILAHSFDLFLGSRDFEEVLFQHFATQIKEEFEFDVYQSATARSKLRTACVKIIKALTALPVPSLDIERLVEGKDVRVSITTEEFEQISLQMLEQVKQLLERALAEANLTADKIHAVEMLGSGSQIPAVLNILTEFFRKQHSEPLESRCCVAKGCALRGAALSNVYRVQEIEVTENFPFSIALSGISASAGVIVQGQPVIVIPIGSDMPCLKTVTFPRLGTWIVDVQYGYDNVISDAAKICSYTIAPYNFSKHERAKLKIRVQLNVHGIVSIDSAILLDNVHKINVSISELIYGKLSEVDIQKAICEEIKMGLQDNEAEKIKESKIALEAYIYDIKDKLNNKYNIIVTPFERDELMTRLQEVEGWLYAAGENGDRSTYTMMLEELKRRGDPIEQRYNETFEPWLSYLV